MQSSRDASQMSNARSRIAHMCSHVGRVPLTITRMHHSEQNVYLSGNADI